MSARGSAAAAVAGAVALVAAGGFTGRELANTSSSSSAASSSCQRVGFQSGVSAAMNRLRKLDPGGTNAAKTGAYDKLERTLGILVFDHDAACASSPPPTTTTTTPTTTAPAPLVAPQTYNAVPNGSNARYCVDGLPRNAAGNPFDAFATYDIDGRQLGGRSENDVAGLRRADNMNGLSPCTGYAEAGRTFPPWPAASYTR